MPSVAISTSSTSTELVAAPGVSRKVRVTGYVIVGAGAVTAQFVNGSTALTGAMLMAAGSNVAAPVVEAPNKGWFDCSDNAALNLTLNTTVAVAGHVAYEVVPSGG